MKLKEGTEINLYAPFLYEIGEEGPHTGNMLNTIEDCIEEAVAEIEDGIQAPMVKVDDRYTRKDMIQLLIFVGANLDQFKKKNVGEILNQFLSL